MIRLNRCHKYKKIHGLLNVTLANGITISPSILDHSAEESSHLFPIEKPTKSNWRLWVCAWRVIASPMFKLLHPL